MINLYVKTQRHIPLQRLKDIQIMIFNNEREGGTTETEKHLDNKEEFLLQKSHQIKSGITQLISV